MKVQRNESLTYLGTIQIDSGKVLVTDPCYIPESLGDDLTPSVKVKPGIWKCYMATTDETDGWGTRVCKQFIVHDDLCNADNFPYSYYEWNNTGFVAGVDSGQLGMMDASLVEKWGGDNRNAEWDQCLASNKGNFNYAGACNATLEKNGSVLDHKMIVTSSGYGDGGYEVFTYFSKDEVLGVAVDFFGDEEDY